MILLIFYGPFLFTKNPTHTPRSPLFAYLLIHSFICLLHSYSVTMIVSDNGREFDNAKLHSLVATHGIHIHFSCPYTSQQNSKAEHIIRTVNDIVRSFLFQASLPPRFWVEALHHATHVLNRLPTKTISAPSSYFSLHNTHPDYSSLHIFGCLCYPNTASTMSHKLAPYSSACIFLGYSPHNKSYRCMDLATHRILISRHVVFDDSNFPYASLQPPSTATYEFLDDAQTIVVPPSVPHTPTPLRSPKPFLAPSPLHPRCPCRRPRPSPPPSPVLSRSPPPVHRTHSTSGIPVLPPREWLNLHGSVNRYSPVPSTRAALKDPNWLKAMTGEYHALLGNNTWDLMSPPRNANIISGKWVFHHKMKPNGSLDR
jgi:histone deacetylase 1/2